MDKEICYTKGTSLKSNFISTVFTEHFNFGIPEQISPRHAPPSFPGSTILPITCP